MWLEILLVFFPVASLVNSYMESDDDESYHNYRLHDDGKFDLLEDLEGKPRRADDGEAPANATMAPEDVEVVKGAIQKLLGNLDLPDYMAPTSPTRSPPPSQSPSSATLVTLLTQLVEDASADRTAAPTTSSRVTRSSYTQLLEQLIEYADSIQMTKKPPLRTTKGQLKIPTRSTRAGTTLEEPGPEPEPAAAPGGLRQRGRGGGRGRRRSTSTPPPTHHTVNTLCTHNAKICATMCFDHEKYRVSCPPTEFSTPAPRADVSRLLEMLSSLVVDYDTNITDKFRQSLIKNGYMPCPSLPTTVTAITGTSSEEPVLYDYEESNKTGAVISKCFVCGLDDEAIPMNAHCSDAFAGEFLPMTPVDASARGHLATYRKYCKFMDMVHWYVNGTDSRSIWGRWTGGCTVRWVDISGVYTQRTCRNRFRPVRGNHFVSKRMAKLEMSLRNVDNGCIISPMASLVPFSRGVSLFARFHACVCTGNWCNRGARLATGTWPLVAHLLLMIMPHS